MLACFTTITEDDAKEILVAVQQDMIFLSPEEIDNLCDVNNLKKVDQTLYVETLENGLTIYMLPNNKVSTYYLNFVNMYKTFDMVFQYLNHILIMNIILLLY